MGTLYSCDSCRQVHDGPPCPQIVATFALLGPGPTPSPTPESVGAQIRALLFSLRDAEHSEASERGGDNSYATDELRARALGHSGACLVSLGRMTPVCGCSTYGHGDAADTLARHASMRDRSIAYLNLTVYEIPYRLRNLREELGSLSRALESFPGGVWATQHGVDAKRTIKRIADLEEATVTMVVGMAERKGELDRLAASSEPEPADEYDPRDDDASAVDDRADRQ
jgi:hypothetical protein